MKIPSSSELPIEDIRYLTLTEGQLDLFKKSFCSTAESIPATSLARAFDGFFEILKTQKIPLEKVLHLSQEFNYQNPLKISTECEIKTKLTKCRTRGSECFATFEIECTQQNKKVADATTMILIRL